MTSYFIPCTGPTDITPPTTNEGGALFALGTLLSVIVNDADISIPWWSFAQEITNKTVFSAEQTATPLLQEIAQLAYQCWGGSICLVCLRLTPSAPGPC